MLFQAQALGEWRERRTLQPVWAGVSARGTDGAGAIHRAHDPHRLHEFRPAPALEAIANLSSGGKDASRGLNGHPVRPCSGRFSGCSATGVQQGDSDLHLAQLARLEKRECCGLRLEGSEEVALIDVAKERIGRWRVLLDGELISLMYAPALQQVADLRAKALIVRGHAGQFRRDRDPQLRQFWLRTEGNLRAPNTNIYQQVWGARDRWGMP